MVETASDEILEGASVDNVALLVVGDPFGATTHADIVIRARELNIPVDVVHNASIMNAVGACGLQLYNFGQTVSIPFWTDTWRPDSWLARIEENARIGLHTLVLLDIKVKEQSVENLARRASSYSHHDIGIPYLLIDAAMFLRGRKIYEPPRYMTPTIALEQIVFAIRTAAGADPLAGEQAGNTTLPTSSRSHIKSLSERETLALSLSRVGTPTQSIRSGTISSLAAKEEEFFGGPLHSLVIVGNRVHPMEVQYAAQWAVDADEWWGVAEKYYGVARQSP